MNRPPAYPEFIEPGEPHWRRWGLWIGLLFGLQSAVLLMLWPKEQPRLELWLWNAVLLVCWALILSARVLAWQLGLFNRKVYLRTLEVATQAWWERRCLGLPVQDVLLMGPEGDEQADYLNVMQGAALSKLSMNTAGLQPSLRCPLSLSPLTERAPSLARPLARLTLTLAGLAECWPQLRALAWVGDESSQAAFVQALAEAGMVLPVVRLPLQNLSDLDDLIETFHRECRDKGDWLLCAGVVSAQSAEKSEVPGEAGFLWRVSGEGRQLLHRGEYRTDESPAVLCAQLQRYAGLQMPPTTCLALDKSSQETFALGGWSAAAHQLSGQWGVLAHLAPFIGMSLALLHAGASGQPCGWLSQDESKRLAIGVAVPYGRSKKRG